MKARLPVSAPERSRPLPGVGVLYAWLATVAFGVTLLDVVRGPSSGPADPEASGGADVLLVMWAVALVVGVLAVAGSRDGRAGLLVGGSVPLGGLSLLAPLVLQPLLVPASAIGRALRLLLAGAVSVLATGAAVGEGRSG